LDDAVPAVRFRAAQGLILGGDANGLPVLIGLLVNGPLNDALQAEDLLSVLAQGKGPAEPLGDTNEQRQKCHDAWKDWLQKNKESLDLANVGVASPFGGLSERASQGAIAFVNNIEMIIRKKADIATLTKTTDVPFSFLGQFTLKTRKEFDDFLKMTIVNDQAKEAEIKFKVLRVVPGADYVKNCPENERGFLEASVLPRVHVVYMDINEGQNQNNTTQIPLFIRLGGGRALCIGLGFPAEKQ
jgi:hypothetical protein